jgi:hypothetical protein
MPLAIPKSDDNSAQKPKGIKLIYIKDEPRVAITAELENGLTITNTHLSFVPGVNVFQLNKLAKYAHDLPGRKLLIGDLNLPANLPQKLAAITGSWHSLVKQNTYPSWKPGIQFDYLLCQSADLSNFDLMEFNIEFAYFLKNILLQIIIFNHYWYKDELRIFYILIHIVFFIF